MMKIIFLHKQLTINQWFEPSLKKQLTSKNWKLNIVCLCTDIGETDPSSPSPRPTWLPETWSTWPKLENPGRDLRDLAERPRPTTYPIETRKTWPRPHRLGRDDWDHGILADGQPRLSLMLKTRSVKLIRH